MIPAARSLPFASADPLAAASAILVLSLADGTTKAGRGAGLIARHIARTQALVTQAALQDHPLPPFDPAAPVPHQAAALAHLVAGHGLIALLAQEVNGHPAAAALDALDWLATSTHGRAFRHRMVALAVAADSTARGESCLATLRAVLTHAFQARPFAEALLIEPDPQDALQSLANRLIERAGQRRSDWEDEP